MSTLVKQIQPDADASLLGLEKYGYSVFPECETTLEIPHVYGRANIGLDKKEDKDLKERFESFFNVKFDTPEGQAWLSDYQIVIKHDVTAYDSKNLKDLWDLHLLKVNGGMGIVAVSDVAIEQTPTNTFKFIVVDEMFEIEEKVKSRELKMAANVQLNKLYEGNNSRLILVAKYLFSVNSGISSKSLAFERLGEFIDQSGNNCKVFLDVLKIDPEHMKIVVSVKEAIFRNIIRMHNNQYVIFATQTPIGRNEEEAIAFLSDPKNRDLLGNGLPDDAPTSILAQLKQYVDN